MAKDLIFCLVCRFGVFMERGAITRAKNAGLNLYCGRECSGIARRKPEITDADRRRAKAEYDREYRAKNIERIKELKREHFKQTYEPDKARVERAAKMPRHVEYCRRPEYRAYKSKYDKEYRAKKDFGPFWEAAVLLTDIQSEVLSRATRYEINLQNDKLNKATKRKRTYEQAVSG